MPLRRRRNGVDLAALPSLDRLAALIERVAELVSAIADSPRVPAPEPVAEPPRDAPEPIAQASAAASAPPSPQPGWVAFVSSPHGYRFVEPPGAAPAPGDPVEVEGGVFRVVRVGPSPLPGDRRPCAYLVGEERTEAGRTSDA